MMTKYSFFCEKKIDWYL